MGYPLELGYETERKGFEVTKVNPFSGSTQPITTPPNEIDINAELGIEPWEYGSESSHEPNLVLNDAIGEDGKVEAHIDLTSNYADRTEEIIGMSFTGLGGMQAAAEAAPLLMKLIAELGDDIDYENFWNPTDGNIKHVANTLLEWTFQHPDAVFALRI